jgi:hypothetical protein
MHPAPIALERIERKTEQNKEGEHHREFANHFRPPFVG